jgi:phosphatidylglycerol:prolipoprotein diacylglycerol transferase
VRPILLDIPAPANPLVLVGLWLVVAVAAALWLWRLHRRGRYTADHLVTGLGVALIAGVVFGLLNHLGHLRVNAYGTMLMSGFLLGSWLGIGLGRRRGLAPERFFDLGLVILIGAIVGARAMYIFITPSAGPFIDVARVAREGLGGLSFHGGLLGGFLTGSLYIAWNRLPFWRVCDSLAPGIALGYALTRIGCFLNGCCFGKPTAAAWALTIPAPADLAASHAHLAVHPVQLYGTAMGLVICGLLVWAARGASLGRAGRIFMAFLALEGLERFVYELFRYPDARFSSLITPAQYVSLGLVLVAVLGWVLLPKQPAVLPAEAPSPHHDRTRTPR